MKVYVIKIASFDNHEDCISSIHSTPEEAVKYIDKPNFDCALFEYDTDTQEEKELKDLPKYGW